MDKNGFPYESPDEVMASGLLNAEPLSRPASAGEYNFFRQTRLNSAELADFLDLGVALRRLRQERYLS